MMTSRERIESTLAHKEPDRIPIDDVPLDHLAGPALILDFSYVSANQAITVSDLIKNGDQIIAGGILVLKTGWDLKQSWKDAAYWTQAPYLDAAAAAWISEQNINAVGFDFPQDYVTREIPDRQPGVREMPAHDLILRKGIYQIEYLCNVHQINVKRVSLIALPLKLAGCEGAPARVVAVLN